MVYMLTNVKLLDAFIIVDVQLPISFMQDLTLNG